MMKDVKPSPEILKEAETRVFHVHRKDVHEFPSTEVAYPGEHLQSLIV